MVPIFWFCLFNYGQTRISTFPGAESSTGRTDSEADDGLTDAAAPNLHEWPPEINFWAAAQVILV